MGSPESLAAALRQIARGFAALAEAVLADTVEPSAQARAAALLSEWGDRGLTRAEASGLFRRYGFAPQTAGGWARADRIETRADGRRYATESSRRWVAGQDRAG